MIHLVGYSDSSSEDEDKRSPSQCCGQNLSQEGEEREEDVDGLLSRDPGCGRQEKKHLTDLPITDESDDQSNDVGSSSNGLPYKQEYSLVCSSLKKQRPSREPPDGRKNAPIEIDYRQQSPHLINCENLFPGGQATNFQTRVVDGITGSPPEKRISFLSAVTDDACEARRSPGSTIPSQDPSVVIDETNVYKSSVSGIQAGNKMFLKSSLMFSEEALKSKDELEPVEAERQFKSQVIRKRKFNGSSDKQLPVPDVIHTMYPGRQQGWVDDPGLHDNRVRSFPHLEGNWATHVFIPVPKNDQLGRFVDHLLELLMPQTFQAHQDFHISLSRTVPIRYHWIEPLVDSLRENLKDLKSCISDLTNVKLFTNDEKTRTFVSIELSQEEREFMDYVRAVDKSFAEFKLPAYYEKPSFHISVGWCLGDVVGKISSEKLLEAQELLGEFVAASPVLGFVYAHEICCQSGCKSFVLTLKGSDR